MKYDLVLFDLDGTLTEPAEGITNAVKYALGRMGRDIPAYPTLLKFIGPPLTESFPRYCGLSEEETGRAIDFFHVYFSSKGIFENGVYEGIPAMLSALKTAGVRLAVATGKPEEFAVKIVRRYGLTEYFDFIGGATMEEMRTAKHEVIDYVLDSIPHAREMRCIMVGDREHDVLGARACGLDCIGVLFGYGTREELASAGCNKFAVAPSDVVKFIL